MSLAFRIGYMAKYAVQAIFLIWGLSLFVTFLYAGYKVKILLKTLPTNLLVRDNSSANQKGRWVIVRIERSGDSILLFCRALLIASACTYCL